MEEKIKNEFRNRYGKEPDILVKAPGRINLIGEHTDYNQGWVLPAAIPQSVYFAFSKSGDHKCSVYSADLNQSADFDIHDLKRSNSLWLNYLLGVLNGLTAKGSVLHGFNCVFGGNIPVGAGLSSSAAMCCGFGWGINQLSGLGLRQEEIAHIAREAEHVYAGVNCGLMDQYACLFGRKDHFLKINCRTFQIEYLDADLNDSCLVLCNSGIKHALAESEYNTRREECSRGLRILKRQYPRINSLSDAGFEQLMRCKKQMPEKIFKRCEYVLEENERVLAMENALKDKNSAVIGSLLLSTHEGLRSKYEVSCTELDFLVETAIKIPGVWGARMMGGGFGGCTINLMKNDSVELFRTGVNAAFRKQYGSSVEFYTVRAEEGISVKKYNYKKSGLRNNAC